MATTKQQLALYTDEERSQMPRVFTGEASLPLETRLLRRLKHHFGRRPLRTLSKKQRAQRGKR